MDDLAFNGIPPADFAVIRPGDVLILRIDERVDMAQAQEIKARVHAKAPGVDVLVISQCQQMAVYRPEGE